MLILSLVALAILAALAVAGAAKLSGAMRLTRFLDADTRTALVARSGVEHALLAVTMQTGTWDRVIHPHSETGYTTLAVGSEGRVFIGHAVEPRDPDDRPVAALAGLIGAESRINLNTASHALLAALLQTVSDPGTPVSPRMLELAQRWADVRAEWVVRKARLTDTVSIPYDGFRNDADGSSLAPAAFDAWHAVLRSALDAGVDPEWIDGIRPFATLYGSGRVNINSAGPTVLTALGLAVGASPGVALGLAETIDAYREEGGVFDQDADAWSVALGTRPAFDEEQRQLLQRLLLPLDGREPLLTVASTCFIGTAEGWIGERPIGEGGDSANGALPLVRRIDFVIRQDPVEVVYWHEY